MITSAIDSLLRYAIDYAGVFPPAALAVPDAVAEYVRVRKSEHAWILGTFVVSSDHVGEVRAHDIPLSVVMRDASAAGVADLLRTGDRLKIAALEIPLMAPQDIHAIAAAAPAHVRLFFEVPPASDLDASLDAIAAAGAFAKIRTGGVTAAAFPAPAAVYRFFKACVSRRLACKATAGLHHAMAGRYRLTYEHGCGWSSMFGFLTISAAAALVYIGAPEDDVVAVLTEPDTDAIAVDGDSLRWREDRISTRDIDVMRRSLFTSFGSCSVQEPIDDLVRMQLA